MSQLAWYQLNGDTASLTQDSSGNDLHTTNTNVTSVYDSTLDTDVAFFNQSAYLTLDQSSVPSSIEGNSSRTYSTWIRSLASGGHQVVFSHGTTAPGGRFVGTLNTSRVNYQDYSSIGQVFGTTVVNDSTWYHVVHMYDTSNDTAQLYVNGVQEFSASKTLSTVNTDFVIGGGSSFSSIRFSGYMTDFRIFGDILTPVEISQLHSNGPLYYTNIETTMYVHTADIVISTVTGATTYTLTREVENSGNIINIIENSSDLTIPTTYDLDPDISYVYTLTTDNSFSQSLTVSTPTLDISGVDAFMTRISNDLSILPQSVLDSILPFMSDVLNTSETVTLSTGKAMFVKNMESLIIDIPKGGILTTFDPSFGGNQNVTLVIDGSNEVVSYDESANQVIVDTIAYDVDEYFKTGKYKMIIKEL